MIIGVVIALLAAGRMALPWAVTRYVNRILADMQDYRGSIAEVDINLYRGAYTVYGLKIFKIHGNEQIPLLDIPVADLSVEWKALFAGSIVGEVQLSEPRLSLIRDVPQKTQTGAGVHWTHILDRVFPVRINRFEIDNGEAIFYDLISDPKVDLRLRSIQLLAANLGTVRDRSNALPSSIHATATSIGDGRLTLDMRMNVLKEIPDLDLDLKFEDVRMPALNRFFQAYANVDVEAGNFNLYSELTVKDGRLHGSIKPLAPGIRFVDVEKDRHHPVQMVWEAIVGALTEIFKNKPKDQLATEVPLTGDLAHPEIGFWPALWNIVHNGFVQAFAKGTDNTIRFDASDQKS